MDSSQRILTTSTQQHGYNLYSRVLHGIKEVLPKSFVIAAYLVAIVYIVVRYRKSMAKPTDEEHCQCGDQHYKRLLRQMEHKPQAFASGVDAPRYHSDAV
ncbi:hypothetical protein CFAM422_005347 [Trichoderma lentiforme]|uniref:Uncharacterized protein n=1 Tax=Trichoderma lentiforme TaxID=1567552 RepID=A0A9P4XHK5_9HYPO|nr:hypothetical protein CFAM422_005347 [Trichoderma lentiforme]